MACAKPLRFFPGRISAIVNLFVARAVMATAVCSLNRRINAAQIRSIGAIWSRSRSISDSSVECQINVELLSKVRNSSRILRSPRTWVTCFSLSENAYASLETVCLPTVTMPVLCPSSTSRSNKPTSSGLREESAGGLAGGGGWLGVTA
jgi:hypothetical protein